MKRLILLGLFVSLPLWSDPDCGYTFAISNPVIQLTSVSQVVQLSTSLKRANHSSTGQCSQYRVFFGRGRANSYTRRANSLSNYVNYNLHKNLNQIGVLKEFADASNTNEYLEGFAPSKLTTYNERFYLSVPGLSINTIRPGYYYDNLQVTIYSVHNGNPNYADAEAMTVLLYIPYQIDVSLVDEGEVFDASATSKVLDFGILAKNQTRGVDLRVVSNTSYRVSLSSNNGSKLKGPGNSTVSYSLKVNNTNISLNSGSNVEIGSGSNTGNAGDKFNMKFQITGETNNLAAGTYQDNITVTAIAN